MSPLFSAPNPWRGCMVSPTALKFFAAGDYKREPCFGGFKLFWFCTSWEKMPSNVWKNNWNHQVEHLAAAPCGDWIHFPSPTLFGVRLALLSCEQLVEVPLWALLGAVKNGLTGFVQIGEAKRHALALRFPLESVGGSEDPYCGKRRCSWEHIPPMERENPGLKSTFKRGIC